MLACSVRFPYGVESLILRRGLRNLDQAMVV